MKKYVILFFVLIMTTGCRVEYNLYVDEKKITEDITLVSENENDNVSIKKFIEPIPAFYDTLIDSESFVKKQELNITMIKK